jgi:hypothetical protein
MAKAPAKPKTTEIEVAVLRQEEVTYCLLGITPFYCNRVAEKARRELLMPRGRMTTAQKAQNLKHDPPAEYRNSPYLRKNSTPGPTRILMLSTAVKGAIAQATVDMPTDVARAQINRLTYVVNDFIPIWGIPQLNMAIVRSADQARTPDIRTRARIEHWASRVTIRYTLPMLNSQSVGTLLSASGMIIGIGDFRQEKGKGNNGLYEIVDQNDPRYLAVIASGGTEQQDAAFANVECSDSETEELLLWFEEERTRRAGGPANDDDEETAEAAD